MRRLSLLLLVCFAIFLSGCNSDHDCDEKTEDLFDVGLAFDAEHEVGKRVDADFEPEGARHSPPDESTDKDETRTSPPDESSAEDDVPEGRAKKTEPDECRRKGGCHYLSCPKGGCKFKCPKDADCFVDCDAGHCKIKCDKEAGCDIHCRGGGCDIKCDKKTNCPVDCRDGRCKLQCKKDAYCPMACDEGGCNTKCKGSAHCPVSGGGKK
ncbi:MAG: hypothetical protein ACNA8W_05715 [Bradymonadaceae bacterium]